MEPVIKPVERELIIKELNSDKFIRGTRRGNNKIFEVTAHDSPNTMREIARLREISFRLAGGGTGKSLDIDHYDTDKEHGYKQLIVWDPADQEILGGYRYIDCVGLTAQQMATSELFDFSPQFIEQFMPYTIELGRSFVQPHYQTTRARSKGLYALDNLWDGLGALMLNYPNTQYFFGKVTMYSSYNLEARNLLLNFLHRYFDDSERLIVPKEPIDYDSNNSLYHKIFEGKEYKEAYKELSKEIRALGENIPPLINSYMNLSPTMRVFGTAINETFGSVEETGIMVNISDIYPEKVDRHITPLRRLAKRFKPKWWKFIREEN